MAPEHPLNEAKPRAAAPARGPVIQARTGRGYPGSRRMSSLRPPLARRRKGCQSITCMIRRERGSTSTARSFTIV